MRTVKVTVEGVGPDEQVIEPNVAEGTAGMSVVWQPDNPEVNEYPNQHGGVYIYGGGFPLEEIAMLMAMKKRTIKRCVGYLREKGPIMSGPEVAAIVDFLLDVGVTIELVSADGEVKHD